MADFILFLLSVFQIFEGLGACFLKGNRPLAKGFREADKREDSVIVSSDNKGAQGFGK
jgi:hypothetical protein